MPRLIRYFAFVLALCLAASDAPSAEPDAAEWTLPQLMAELAAVRSASAHYVERKYLHMLKEPLVESGTLFYQAPDIVRKITLEPQTEDLTVDGDLLTMDREGKKESLRLEQYPEIWAIIEGIRGTLAGDRVALDRYYLVDLQGGAASWRLSLVPRDPKIEKLIRSIQIFGDGAHIRRIVTDEEGGDRSEMTIAEDRP